MKYTMRKKREYAAGFTLVEVLISIALFVGVALAIGTFIKTTFDYQLLFTQQLTAQQEIETTFAVMLPEMRAMIPSALGGYAIASVATSSITFFGDIDSDGIGEQVRYFLSGTVLRKGIIDPSGNPLSYTSATEIITDVTHDVVADTSIFTYYDEHYTGSELAMTYPIKISNIRLIKVALTVHDPNKAAPLSAAIEIVPRNLRTNL